MRYLFSTFLFLVLFVFAGNTYAQSIVQQLKKPMPEFEKEDVAAFNKKSSLHSDVPFNDQFLEYSVRLPKNWAQPKSSAIGNLSLSNKVLGEVERYYGPVRIGERSYFSLKAVELEYQLTAEQWFILFVLENGYTLEGMEVVDGTRVNTVYVLVDKGQSYVVNAAAIVNGTRIVFAQYVTPAEEWEKERSDAYHVVQSFDLKNVDTSYVEKMTPYQFLDIAELEYPESWQLIARPLRSAEEMSVELLNVKKDRSYNYFNRKQILKGKMEIHLIANYVVDDIDEVIREFIQKSSINQLVIGSEVEEYDDFVLDEQMELVEVKAYEAVDQTQSIVNYEFWLAVMQAGEHFYFVTLLTPSRDADYYNWARNSQTLRVVVENIVPIL